MANVSGLERSGSVWQLCFIIYSVPVQGCQHSSCMHLPSWHVFLLPCNLYRCSGIAWQCYSDVVARTLNVPCACVLHLSQDCLTANARPPLTTQSYLNTNASFRELPSEVFQSVSEGSKLTQFKMS